MRRISGARTKALRTGLSFVLTFAMTVGSLPMDGIAYASITKGAQAPQTETKVEVSADNAAAMSAGVAADTTNISTDVTADKPKTVKVRFDANGGEGHMDDFEVTLNNSDWSVAEMPFIRDGYRFVGWSIAAEVAKDVVDDPETDIDESLTGLVLADKQGFVDLVSQKRDEDGNVVETHDFGKYVSDDVLTLYAQWEKVETTEVSEPVVVDENVDEVAKTEENVDEAVGNDEVVEDTSVVEDSDSGDVALDEEKELDREFLSGAFGGKTDGGVADKIGTSNPLSRKLMAPLMAAAAPSLTTQSTPEGSREGTAYAVLDSAGTLTFFRSTKTYSASSYMTVTDVMGKTYTGRVFTGVETKTGTSYSSASWYTYRTSVKLARIADGQVIAPKSCAGWFYYCSNMTAFEGADRLDTSSVARFDYMFQNCSAMVAPPSIGGWNTSAVTNMYCMFQNCTKLAEPPSVGSWDTSGVTNMYRMFYGCSKMTSLDVSGWNFSKVTSSTNYLGLQLCSVLRELKVPVGAKITGLPEHSAQGMDFATWGNAERGITGVTASKLMSTVNAGNGAGTWTWDTMPENGAAYGVLDSAGTLTLFRSKNVYTAGAGKTVTDVMGNTYTGQLYDNVETNTGTSYISAPWYSKHTSVKLARIADGQVIAPKSCAGWFYGCSNMTAFDGAERLDTGSVTSMYYMFYGCSKMTEPPLCGNWDTSAVTDMGYMFSGCSKMTEPPLCGNWNTSAVINMIAMFSNCSSMVEPPVVNSWSTSAVTNMSNMFNGCSKMAEPPVVNSWNTSAVTNMLYLFNNCKSITEPPAVGSWNTSKVTSMSYMFNGCSAMAEPPAVGNWDVSSVTYMSHMFDLCSSMTEPPSVGDWNTSAVTEMAYMFSGCSSMTEPPSVGDWDTSESCYMSGMFQNCSSMTEPPSVGHWNTNKVFDVEYMFNGCSSMVEPPLVGGWNTSAVTDMSGMFADCVAIAKPPVVGDWDTSAVTDMTSVFSGCSSITEPPSVGDWNTSAVTEMAYMFNGCSSMTEPPSVGDWDTSEVAGMSNMFSGCSKMTEPPAVGAWDTSKVYNMYCMFQGCSSMTEPPSVGNWDTSMLSYAQGLFQGCSSMTEPPSVGNWNTSAVGDMADMFDDCSKMTSLDISGWDFSNIFGDWSYLGLQNCSALRKLKVPAGAKVVDLPEHEAYGDYLATWGNAEQGITGLTAANLMNTVNAGNGAGTWMWDGVGYTVNFMVDGSGSAMQAEQVKADEDYTVPSCEVTKLYHDFVEWSGSDGKTYHTGDTITAGTFAAGETLTLTAVFAPHEYGPGEIEGNLQLSVPASINFVVEPDGTLTGPSNASIANNSAVSTRVSSIEVKELDGFNFVANAENSGEQNAVELRFGPLSDMLDAASFLSKSGVADAAWTMGTTAGQNTVQLETEGKVAHVGADITKTNKFGEIRWYVKAGE